MILTSHPESAAHRVRARIRQIHPQIFVQPEIQLPQLLQTLPILSKSDLTRHLSSEEHLLETAVLFSETSGTTGQTLQTPRGACDLSWNANNQAIAYRRYLQPGVDRVALLHPCILSPFIEASSIALRELHIGQVRVYPIPRVCDYRRIFEVLERYKITTVMSTPSLAYKLLYEFTKLEIGRHPHHLKKLMLTGEEVSVPSICNFKKILGIDALVVPIFYGSSEAATLMLGREDGLFDPILDDFIFELGEAGQDNERKLLVTWLREGLMPILRYDTGDCFTFEPATYPALRFLGRVGTSSTERKLLYEIEKTIYALDIPVFHYEGKYSEVTREIQISVVIATANEATKLVIEEKLNQYLPSWQTTVHVNPNCLKFMHFSPAPKIRKLTSC